MLDPELIPAPSVVRERLARNHREARLLRSLLKLSYKAVQSRDEHERAYLPSGPLPARQFHAVEVAR